MRKSKILGQDRLHGQEYGDNAGTRQNTQGRRIIDLYWTLSSYGDDVEA